MHIFVRRLLILITTCSLMLYGLQKAYFIRLDWLDSLAARCAYPWYAVTGSISNRVTNWRNEQYAYDDLKTRYETLQKEHATTLEELIAVNAERHTYAQIKELLTFAERYNIAGTQAHIMVKNLDDTSHYYLVNVGSRDGIKKDMVAIYQRHLVGRVTEVYDWYSKIMLITDEKSKVAAYTSKTHAPGIVQGYNVQTSCNFTYVSHLYQVVDNDLIISSGQGQIYPQGFCVGKIVWHSIKEKELYHYIEIKPIINLHGLSNVMIIDPSTIMQF